MLNCWTLGHFWFFFSISPSMNFSQFFSVSAVSAERLVHCFAPGPHWVNSPSPSAATGSWTNFFGDRKKRENPLGKTYEKPNKKLTKLKADSLVQVLLRSCKSLVIRFWIWLKTILMLFNGKMLQTYCKKWILRSPQCLRWLRHQLGWSISKNGRSMLNILTWRHGGCIHICWQHYIVSLFLVGICACVLRDYP